MMGNEQDNKKSSKTQLEYIDIDTLLKVNATDVAGNNVQGRRKKALGKGSRSYASGRHTHNKFRHSRHSGRMRGWSNGVKVLAAVILAMLCIIVVGAGIIFIKWSAADHISANMFHEKNTVATPPQIEVQTLNDDSVATEAADEIQGKPTISYDGKTYLYNDNLVNILFLGIDNKGDSQDDGTITAHQADSLVLAVMDVVKKQISFINIPRDAVTQIQMMDLNNEYVKTLYGPIATQHSYGDGGTGSNEATVNTVSNLLYSIPIYRYAAIDMTAVPTVNDAVGGVTVDILEDMTKWNIAMKQGVQYTLMGKDATIYVCRRDTSIDDSAVGRMKRQSQYLKALFQAGKQKTKNNILFPVTTFLEIKEKVETNLTTDEITYLARQALEMDLEDDHISTLPGEMRQIEAGEYEDYAFPMGYVLKEKELRQMLIDTFYIEVSPE